MLLLLSQHFHGPGLWFPNKHNTYTLRYRPSSTNVCYWNVSFPTCVLSVSCDCIFNNFATSTNGKSTYATKGKFLISLHQLRSHSSSFSNSYWTGYHSQFSSSSRTNLDRGIWKILIPKPSPANPPLSLPRRPSDECGLAFNLQNEMIFCNSCTFHLFLVFFVLPHFVEVEGLLSSVPCIFFLLRLWGNWLLCMILFSLMNMILNFLSLSSPFYRLIVGIDHNLSIKPFF